MSRSRPAAPRRPTILLIAGAVLGAVLAAAGLSAPTGEGLPPDVVAMVNDAPIRTEDFARMVDAVAADRREPLTGEDRQRVLDRLIDEELLVQRGLTLDLPRVDRRVRADLTQTVIDGIASQAGDREPSEDDLRAFYDSHRDFFAGPGRLRVRQVFVRVTAPSDPARCGRRSVQSRQARQTGRFDDAGNDATSTPRFARIAAPPGAIVAPSSSIATAPRATSASAIATAIRPARWS